MTLLGLLPVFIQSLHVILLHFQTVFYSYPVPLSSFLKLLHWYKEDWTAQAITYLWFPKVENCLFSSMPSEGFEKSWSSSKLWIFHNLLCHLFFSFIKVPIKNLVELSWRKKCLWCPKVVYCLFGKIASFQPSSGP